MESDTCITGYSFVIGDTIVHPMHGAGIIENIVEQKVAGFQRTYYVVRIPVGGMVVMIPTFNTREIGVRPVMSREMAGAVLDSLGSSDIQYDQNWNRRYRDNMTRIKSGNAFEVARVVSSLLQREKEKALSTGERKLLNSAKQILISELVLAMSSSFEDVEGKIKNLC